MFSRLFTFLLQVSLMYLAAGLSFNVLPIGEGWEIGWLIFVASVVVWGVGWVMSILPSLSPPRLGHFIMTAACAALGGATILLSPALGLVQILFPGIGALIGYYLSRALFRDE